MEWLRRLFSGGRETTPGGDPVRRHEGGRARAMGLPDVPPEWSGEREAFYARYFGKPECVLHEVHARQPHIDVYACGPSKALERDWHTFVTSGMSDLPMHVPKELPEEEQRKTRRAELLMYVTEADWVTWRRGSFPHGWLHWLAQAVHEWETHFAPTHTVPNGGDPPAPLLPGSALTTAFFMPAIHESEEARHELDLGGDPVNLLWVVLISNPECEYKVNRGAEVLITLLEGNSHPRCVDMFRRSYV